MLCLGDSVHTGPSSAPQQGILIEYNNSHKKSINLLPYNAPTTDDFGEMMKYVQINREICRDREIAPTTVPAKIDDEICRDREIAPTTDDEICRHRDRSYNRNMIGRSLLQQGVHSISNLHRQYG